MAPDKMSQLSIESSSWDMKARMTCIGHKSPAILSDYAHILSDYAHILCAHQPIQQNFPVRSKSYSVFHIPMSCSF